MLSHAMCDSELEDKKKDFLQTTETSESKVILLMMTPRVVI